MNKSIYLFVVTLTLSNLSNAGDYSDAADNQTACEQLGRYTSKVYDDRKSAKKFQMYKTHIKDMRESANNYLAFTPPMTKFALILKEKAMVTDYALYDAINSKDAYMHSWGECMDFVDIVGAHLLITQMAGQWR